jgi:ankyrin repeat protein
MKKSRLFCCVLSLICLLTDIAQENVQACTIGVASGKATADGRPLLWTNDDEVAKNNYEVVYLRNGRFKHLGVVVPDSEYFGGGVNEFGFCIVDSLAFNLTGKSENGMYNIGIMRLALRQCVTVDDFENLLKQTNVSGRMTADNFGVIDAFGGAVIFETGNSSYTRFDATDPKVAPQGYIVRANFALTGRTDGNVGRARYDRANQLCRQAVESNRLDYRYVLREVCRDFSGAEGVSYSWPEMDVTEKRDFEVLDTENSISNHLTRWVALFHGVRPDENPSFTTFWAILGTPILSVAVPSWVIAESTAPELDDEKFSSICTITNSLYLANYVADDKRKFLLNPEMLPGISAITYLAEDRIFDQTDSAMTQWRQDYPTAQQVASFHRSRASEAMRALEDTTEMLVQKGGPTASLRLALHMGSVKKAKAFIEGNTNINVPDGHGYTPLHYAVQNNQTEIVKLLISKNADVNAKNSEGQTALDIAVDRNRKEIAELLLAKGALLPSIHAAARIGNMGKVKAFLEEGVDVNTKDAAGLTALHMAARAGHKDMVELLLARGADMNAKEAKWGGTPLNSAIWGGQVDVAEVLLANGANVNVRGNYNWTPLHDAAWHGQKVIVELLITHGADIHAKAENWATTPLDSAASQGHKDVADLLRQHGARE